MWLLIWQKTWTLFFVQGPEPISSLDLGQVVKITNSVTPTKNATVHIQNTPMSIAEAARVFLNVATLAASVVLPLYMAMNYPLSPFAYNIKWVTGWFHWSQQSLIICITCNILSSHKASHSTHLSEIWRKFHKNYSQLQDESSDYLLGAAHKVWDHEWKSLLTHYFYPTTTMVGAFAA